MERILNSFVHTIGENTATNSPNRHNDPNKHGNPLKSRYTKSKAVRDLETMANDAARLKYPNVPYLAPRIYTDKTANGLTKCIIDFLTFAGQQAERISNTGRMIDTRQTFEDVIGNTRIIGGTNWIPGTGTNGTADVSATIAGRSVKIEVKIGRDIQSPAQKNYQKSIESAGGIYVIASTFEGFLSWFILNNELI
jgi:hypothetical protein